MMGLKKCLRFAISSCFLGLLVADYNLWAEESMKDKKQTKAETQELKREELVKDIVKQNRELSIARTSRKVGELELEASKGIYEPVLSASMEYSDTERETTVAEAQANLQEILSQGVGDIAEKSEGENLVGALGVNTLLPMGTQVHVGYTFQNIKRNSNGFNTEYIDFIGFEFTQPLLRGFGRDVTEAGIDVAEKEYEVRKQQLRSKLLQVIMKSERAYWEFCRSYELQKMRKESENRAMKLLNDVKNRKEAGSATQMDVYQAETGLSQRQAETEEAAQRLRDVRNQLKTLLSEDVMIGDAKLVPAEELSFNSHEFKLQKSIELALACQPDYLIADLRLRQARIRKQKAGNAMKPQVDLIASYGFNAYSPEDRGDAVEDFSDAEYGQGMVGVRVQTGLRGNRKAKAEFEAAKLQLRQRKTQKEQIRTQLINALDIRIKQLNSLSRRIEKLRKSVEFNEQLLNVTTVRLESGKEDMRKVLEVEEELVDAQENLLVAVLNYREVYLQWESLRGTLLRDRNVEAEMVQKQPKMEEQTPALK